MKKLLLFWRTITLDAPDKLMCSLLIPLPLFLYIFVPAARTIALLLPIAVISWMLFIHIITIIVIWLVGDWNNVDWS